MKRVNTCNMNIRRKRKREVEKLTRKGVEKVKEKWRKENRGTKVGQEKSGKSKRKK
jgi:hypothetical protein